MAQIDTYRNNMQRTRQELAALRDKKAKESAKIPGLKSKIQTAESAIKRTKSKSTIKSKINEIDRAEKCLAEIDKAMAAIEKKIAAKEKEYNCEEKKYKA